MGASLAQLAASQGGALTRAQAVTAGLTDQQIRTLLASAWTDPYRGVYVERAALAAATPQQRHVLLTAARVLTTTLAAVGSHRTAALVHQLPILGPRLLHPSSPGFLATRATARRPRC